LSRAALILVVGLVVGVGFQLLATSALGSSGWALLP
jgi:hypothetical protein